MINSMRLLTRELEQMALRPIYVPVNEKKRVKIFGVELAYLYLFGIGTAFVGWLAENLARSNLLCISLICGAVFAGELAVGNMWERCFGVELWDYSDFPLQVTQYAGLVPSLAYGGGAYLIFRFVYKPVIKLLQNKVDFRIAKAICCTLGVAIVLDTLAMGLYIAVLNTPPVYWSVKVW